MNPSLHPGTQSQDEYIGIIFHELKTPLTIITALLQLMNTKFDTMDENMIRKHLVKTGDQVKKMKNLINGFLNVSFLESGELDIHKTDIKLDHLIGEIADEMRCMLNNQYIILDCCSPMVVNADRDKIACVLSNLLCNAAKYSGSGKYIYVKCFRSATHVIVRIKDEGIGIRSDHLKKVFERYFREDCADIKHVEGFGIGLYLSAAIIERHHGMIWAESEAGEGSTFYFTLPLA